MPCGIFDDKMRFTGLFEDVRTIQKAQVIGAQRTFFAYYSSCMLFYSRTYAMHFLMELQRRTTQTHTHTFTHAHGNCRRNSSFCRPKKMPSHCKSEPPCHTCCVNLLGRIACVICADCMCKYQCCSAWSQLDTQKYQE